MGHWRQGHGVLGIVHVGFRVGTYLLLLLLLLALLLHLQQYVLRLLLLATAARLLLLLGGCDACLSSVRMEI